MHSYGQGQLQKETVFGGWGFVPDPKQRVHIIPQPLHLYGGRQFAAKGRVAGALVRYKAADGGEKSEADGEGKGDMSATVTRTPPPRNSLWVRSGYSCITVKQKM